MTTQKLFFQILKWKGTELCLVRTSQQTKRWPYLDIPIPHPSKPNISLNPKLALFTTHGITAGLLQDY